MVQYNVCLATTGAIPGTNRGSIHAELGLESLLTKDGIESYIFSAK